jgi:hypothetical protein
MLYTYVLVVVGRRTYGLIVHVLRVGHVLLIIGPIFGSVGVLEGETVKTVFRGLDGGV